MIVLMPAYRSSCFSRLCGAGIAEGRLVEAMRACRAGPSIRAVKRRGTSELSRC
jgi:hypothetical protein